MQVIYLMRFDSALFDVNNIVHQPRELIEGASPRIDAKLIQFVELSDEQLETLKLIEDGTYTAEHAENVQRAYDRGRSDEKNNLRDPVQFEQHNGGATQAAFDRAYTSKEEAYQAGYMEGKSEQFNPFGGDDAKLFYMAKQLRATVDPITAIQEACKINPQMIDLIGKAWKSVLHENEVDPRYVDDTMFAITDVLSRAIPSATMTDVPKSENSEESK